MDEEQDGGRRQAGGQMTQWPLSMQAKSRPLISLTQLTACIFVPAAVWAILLVSRPGLARPNSHTAAAYVAACAASNAA